jgi:hypothetical protein
MRREEIQLQANVSTVIATGEDCNINILKSASQSIAFSFEPMSDINDAILFPSLDFYLPEGKVLYGFYGSNATVKINYYKKM